MLACGCKIPGARISDFGFYLVLLVALLAGFVILMGMKVAFDDQEAYEKEREQAIVSIHYNA